MPADDRLIDPDCAAGKHGSCAGDPCECGCHQAPEGCVWPACAVPLEAGGVSFCCEDRKNADA